MKRHLHSAVSAMILIVSGVSCYAESPGQFAHRFCTSEQSFEFRGLPDRTDERLYDHLVGIELIRSFRSANDALEHWMARHRNTKESIMIPHIEANLFSGFSEGPTTFRVGRAEMRSGRVTVKVHRDFRDRLETHSWTDILILDRDSSGWVVYDIQTHHSGSLIDQIHAFRESVMPPQRAQNDHPKANDHG
jgi:hypothetical protein